MPSIGRLWNPRDAELVGIRFYPVRHFHNWLVFYRERPDGIEVVRVIHGQRDLESIFASDRA
jgi:toxin ParE1/3/4